MKVYKCDRCGKELAEVTYSPCYSADPDKIVFHIDFCEGAGQLDVCPTCHKDMMDHFESGCNKEDTQ